MKPVWLLALSAGAAMAQDAAALAFGQKVFNTSCAVGYCHGADGTANRGPRLRGRSLDPARVSNAIRKGIPNTAMPGFEGKMKSGELEAVIAYVNRISSGTAPAEAAAQQAPPPAPLAATPQQSPAEGLFHDALREVRCGTCHEWNGKGINVAAIKSDVIPATPVNVKRATLRNGESFPALVASENMGVVRLYDLTVAPPVLRSIDKGDIASLGAETQWKHASVTGNYTQPELASILRAISNR